MVDYQDDITRCIAALKAGQTIIYPTDTVWGIGCDATNAEAIEKVFALKHRPANKSMIVLVCDFSMLTSYVAGLSQEIKEEIGRFSKPTTVIYQQAKKIAENALAADGSIGIRLVENGFCNDLIRAFGKPIVSTSANISGYPTASLFGEIDQQLLNGADYVVRYRQDDQTIHQPSKIVRFDEDGNMIVLRA